MNGLSNTAGSASVRLLRNGANDLMPHDWFFSPNNGTMAAASLSIQMTAGQTLEIRVQSGTFQPAAVGQSQSLSIALLS
jgi:hypothetical protein